MSRQILGNSAPIRELLKLIQKVAGTKTNVLIIGDSGTGKELVARMIHDTGPLKDRPFVPVNCGAIPETLIESEMFGYRKGSFTGAIGDKAGLFEAANGGTLFLDEVGELPILMQVKLLRAIQERAFRKVGGTEDIRVDVRIIAATNRDLEAAVAKGTFREDLYYRLNVILIKTPPLRARREDIRLLAEQFIEKSGIRPRPGKPVSIDSKALAALEAYDWPGNVRELENAIERAITLESSGKITLESFPKGIQEAFKEHPATGPTVRSSENRGDQEEIKVPLPDFSKGHLDLDQILGEIERVYLLKALEHAGGIKKKAADLLGITFRSIRYRLNKLGIESEN